MMLDRLKNTTIQDLAFATALGIDMKEVEKLDIFKQKNEMQCLAFRMQDSKTTITQDEADMLNAKYEGIVLTLECHYDTDLSGDYQINFNSFVPGNAYYNRFAY